MLDTITVERTLWVDAARQDSLRFVCNNETKSQLLTICNRLRCCRRQNESAALGLFICCLFRRLLFLLFQFAAPPHICANLTNLKPNYSFNSFLTNTMGRLERMKRRWLLAV